MSDPKISHASPDAASADAAPQSEGKPWREERTLRTSASPEQVYRAWADPEILAQWFPDEAYGEAAPGEELVHVWRDFGMELRHRVVEAVPNERLVLEGTSPMGFEFLQEIRIERDGDETVLRLVHSGFGPDADLSEELDGVDSGWRLALSTLRHYLEAHFGVARTSAALIVRPADFEWEQAARFFRDEERLARWLTHSGSIGPEGSRCRLEIVGAGPLSGRVLAVTGREVAVSWEELPGILELKAFGAARGQRMVGVRLSSWGAPRERLVPALDGLRPAVERLAAAFG